MTRSVRVAATPRGAARKLAEDARPAVDHVGGPMPLPYAREVQRVTVAQVAAIVTGIIAAASLLAALPLI